MVKRRMFFLNGNTWDQGQFFVQPEISIGATWWCNLEVEFRPYLANNHHLGCLIMILHIFPRVPRFLVHTTTWFSAVWRFFFLSL